jgi:hypothetical protein
MQGKGVFHYPDGQIYTGSYVKDKKEGYGELMFPNGNGYKGGWKQGMRHG